MHALSGVDTRMVLGQGRKYTRMVLARVARVTASFVHAVRGLICTRGQGPRLYTRNGFAVCTPLFLQLCILCAPCVQVVRYRSLAVLPLCILCAPCVQVVRFITMLFGHVYSLYRSSPFRSTLNTGYITGLDMCKVKSMYQSSPLRSTLNTGYITGLDMCTVCTEAVHSVAL